ncbi:class I SAM-dependent methyltransferase [Salinicoccus albus]|uniref:class I SAM-dependent methyltransferase n=1 Tax=Salinicoccus albus TaxID=418756 RepID=UPI000368873F|nr:class I SAM-dependent methyltransferase [Salinicoccus albus]
MEQTSMEQVYHALIEETDRILEGNPDATRLEALGEALIRVENTGGYSDLRKAFQFAYLYQTKEEPVQPNHQLTPDSIGYFISHIIQLFNDGPVKMLDAGSGTGHLSMTIREHKADVELYGAEVDPLLANVNANVCEYLETSMNIYPQNIIEQARLPLMDVAVGDLPVGYYPLNPAGFTTAFKEGKSFAHLLMLESAMHYVKDDGLGIFVVPSDMLEENNETIKKYLSESATLLMFLKLPNTIFKTENQRKSIIVLKKNFSPLTNNEVLIGDIPDFKDTEQFKHFLAQTESWYDSYINN